MKFLCPSCKAKYQIADEKVIGRSVKMKCRQCGYIIEIQEAVVEASAGGVSQPPIALNSVPAPALAPPPKPAKAPAEKSAPRPQQSTEGLSTHHVAKAIARPQRPGTGQPQDARSSTGAAAQGSRNLPSAPRHAPLGHPTVGAPQRPTSSLNTQAQSKAAVADKAGATGPASERKAQRPNVVRPQASPAGAGLDALRNLGGNKSAQPLGTPSAPAAIAVGAREPSLTASPAIAQAVTSAAQVEPNRAIAGSTRRAGDALAEAFASAVGVAPAVVEPSVGDEWYVGVDDNPIGPIPLADLRARAARGQVTVDSLVWRDGFEDWKPVRSFPELLAVVEEAISSVNASRGPILAPRAQADFGPVVTLSPPTERLLVASAVQTAAEGAQASAPAASQVVPVVSPILTPEELAAATGRKPHRTPAAVWVAVGGAVALGLAIGFVLFRPAPAPPVIKYVTVAPSASAAPVVAAPTPSGEVPEAPIVASAESISAKVRRPASGEVKAPAESTAVKTATGLAGLQDLRTVGPRSGPGDNGSTSGATGGQGLDSATLQKTVSRYTASVRRSCWQPALDSRSPDAPTSARVSVKIDISASGNVSAASSSGDPKGYRGLASCIESRVRNWTFPPSSGSTTVNVPFVFAAQ